MNFTREPLIETVITPRDGYKILLRNSKNGAQEEFLVDAVEVISFGKATFFRSLEKPKCFLVPVADYELIEEREARVALKASTTERGIKIGGGRETQLKIAKDEPILEATAESGVESSKPDKKRERRRSRKKHNKQTEAEVVEREEESSTPTEEIRPKRGEKPSLIPPPSALISEMMQERNKILASESTRVVEEHAIQQPIAQQIETQDFDEEEPGLY